LPFFFGEEITYTVRWEMIKAGNATLKVLPLTKRDGKNAYHFELDARSARYIDMLYKIRARLEAITDMDFTQSLLYKDTQSGKKTKTVKVNFNWKKKRAVYSNFGKKRTPIDIPLNTFDPLSAFYKMRTLPFEINQTLSFSVTDGKKVFTQKGQIISREKISVSSKTYDTYQMDIEVNHFSGVFKKSENPTVKLWIMADERKILVRIKVKVFIGSVIFDLVSVK